LPLDKSALRVGSEGCFHFIFKVFDIISDTEMHISSTNSKSSSYPLIISIRGHNTKGLVAGQEIFPANDLGSIRITGTKTYRTAAGGRNTIFVAEPTLNLLRPEQAKLDAKQKVEVAEWEKRVAPLLKARQERDADWASRGSAKASAARAVAEKKRREAAAANRLPAAKQLAEKHFYTKARERLRDLLRQYPGTAAAKEATKMLKELE
jgi:hypothetical protein